MTRITARVPVRVDLAGGTLDLWPLYLFHPGSRTVNAAISLWAEVEVEETGDSSIEVFLTDADVHARFHSIRELAGDERMALLAKALEHFRLSGLRITTRTEAPRGSGLGGSSALAVALVRALSILADNPVENDDLIDLVRDLETRLLGIPAGVQDYYPAVYGGLAALHLDPGKVVRHPLNYPLATLNSHMVIHYSGVAHFSGTNNWDMYKGRVDRNSRMVQGLEEISKVAIQMERALEAHDPRAAGEALAAEWEARKRLVDGITTPEVDAVVAIARGAGAWGAKVCGAGGGGCIVILAPAEKREAVIAALRDAPGQTLDVGAVPTGLTIEETREPGTYSAVHRRGMPGDPHVEQFWADGEGSTYRPHVLAEAAVTFDVPRHGIHRTVTRSFLAPIDLQSGVPRWHAGVPAPELDLKTSPEPGRDSILTREASLLQSGLAEGEELLRQLLLETEKLPLFYNPSFETFSQPGEGREEFVRRCQEEAERNLETESERLEKTFRRRIDQLRERSERDRRIVEDQQEQRDTDLPPPEIGIAWGQTLYNITSGRPATTDSPRSANEADYVDKISLLQKAWKRELEVLREELTSRARNVEEVVLTPTPRGIETRRYLIVWIPGTRS